MQKKILSILTTVAIILILLPISVFAEASTKEASDVAILTTAISNATPGDTIKLESNISNVTSSIILGEGRVAKSLTLDLNGHTISGNVIGGLIQILNNAGSETATITITDNSADNKGSLKNESGSVIATAAKEAAKIEVEIDGGIIVSTASSAAAINASNFTKLTIKNATVRNEENGKVINVGSTSSLVIQNGAFYGEFSIASNEGNSVTGGYFSNYNADLAKCVPSGSGIVSYNDEEYENMYKIGAITDETKQKAEAKIKLGNDDNIYVYGTIQQLFELYRGRGIQFEVLKTCSLTLDGYGSSNSGVFNAANTLSINVAKDATFTLNSTNTKVAKFVIEGEGTKNKTITPATNYISKNNDTEVICDLDPASNTIIATAIVDGETRYLTADNVEAFLNKVPEGTTTITFQKDYDLKYGITIPENADVTIDLGGKTLTYIGSLAAIKSIDGGKFTLKNGTLDASQSETGLAISLGVTASNKIVDNKPTEDILPDYDSKGEAVLEEGIVIKGTVGVFNASKLTMESGSSVEAESFAITGNGAHDGTTITINEGAVVNSQNTAAIYHPQGGTLTINGGEIEGKAGIVARDGDITVNGGTITANGTDPISVGDAGYTVEPSGIVMDKNSGYGTDETTKAVINSGDIIAADGKDAVVVTENGEEANAPGNALTVKGGNYSASVNPDYLDESLTTELEKSSGDAPFSYYNDITTATEAAKDDPNPSVALVKGESLATITDIGFAATKDEADAALGKLIGEGYSKDAGNNTMWVLFKGDPGDYGIWVEKDGEKIYTENGTIEEDQTGYVIYFSFEQGGGASTAKEIASGDYTVYLATVASPEGQIEEKPADESIRSIKSISLFKVTIMDRGSEISSQFYVGNSSVTLPELSRSGYSLTWVTDDEEISVSNSAVTLPETGGKDITVTAQWESTGGGSTGGNTGSTSGSGSSSSSEKATLTPEVKPNSNGEVNTTIQSQAVTDGIKDAQKKGEDAVVIAPQVEGETDKVTVTVPKTSVVDVGKAGLDLKVETDLGDITIPADSAKHLNNQDGSRVTVSVEAKEDGSTGIEVKVGNEVIEKLRDGLKAELPAVDGNVLVLIGEDGTKTVVKKSVVEDDVVRALLDGSCTVQLEDRSQDFEDVSSGQWFEGAVDFASSHELFKGVTDTTFNPDGTMTRGMLATVLWRLEGEAKTASTQVFQDIQSGSWFEEGVAWANDKGIVQGYGDGTFGPDDDITREQLATMLYRYAQQVGMNTRTSGDLSKFADQSSVSSYATAAMQWAVGTGLVQGMADGTLNPRGNATRAEVATIMQRLITLMVQ